MPQCLAKRERRKLSFLKAFVRIGTISRAAKACRISRDAVHDWLRNDPSFARAFQHAEEKYEAGPLAVVDSTVIFFKDIIRPLIPQALWPSVCAELAIASTNLKHELKEGRLRRADPPRKQPDVSLSPNGRLPERFADVAIPNRASDTSAPI